MPRVRLPATGGMNEPDRGSGRPDPRRLEPWPAAWLARPSAYLRQHAGNPVHWRPFGDAGLRRRGRPRDVPVFVSVGYAACHWCHVMADESFEDQATAEYLNAHFVAVKVDREERPDVDAVYMSATQAISGEGGWPMSVFLLPDGRAFHAGTYFPPRPMPGRPSFRQVLEAVTEAWPERRGPSKRMPPPWRAASPRPRRQPRYGSTAARARGRGASGDGRRAPCPATKTRIHGGFGGAPKFPPSAVLDS